MDLKEALLEEHSKAQCDKIVAYINGDRQKFARLMKLFLEGEYRITQRAGWPLSYCIIDHPDLVKPYYGKLLKYLSQRDAHPAVLRNITRLFQHTDIPKRYHGQLMDLCFFFIASGETPVAIRAFSLTILEKMLHSYPEIAQELQLIIEENFNRSTAAFKSRANKVLKEIRRLKAK